MRGTIRSVPTLSFLFLVFLEKGKENHQKNKDFFFLSVPQKPGDHPNFRKNALGVKRPFSELSESSGYSRSRSRNWKFHSRNTKFHSRNGLSRLEQYEAHNSRSNSRSDSRNCREPTRKIFICPAFSERFFKPQRRRCDDTHPSACFKIESGSGPTLQGATNRQLGGRRQNKA